MCTPEIFGGGNQGAVNIPTIAGTIPIGKKRPTDEGTPTIPQQTSGSQAPGADAQQQERVARISARDEERRRLARRGRRPTILTTGASLQDPANIQRKTLLGG